VTAARAQEKQPRSSALFLRGHRRHPLLHLLPARGRRGAQSCSVALRRPDAFRLYRVYEFARAPRLFTLAPPLEQALVLETATWQAGFG
jgi:hypothetical protein